MCFLFLLSLINARNFLTDFSCCFPSSELCLKIFLLLVVLPYSFSSFSVLLYSFIFALISFWLSVLSLYFFFSASSLLSDHKYSFPFPLALVSLEPLSFPTLFPLERMVTTGKGKPKLQMTDVASALCCRTSAAGELLRYPSAWHSPAICRKSLCFQRAVCKRDAAGGLAGLTSDKCT